MLLSDVPVQASVDIATHDVQTDIQDNADADSQTELSIAWRSERDTQATVETAESVVQAAVETSEMTTQVVTEVADSTVQASVDVNESVMQTDYLGLSADCQTDVSMAREADCEVQVGAETLTASSQTDLNTGESSSQTEVGVLQQSILVKLIK